MAKFKLADGTEIEAFTPEELKAEVEKETSGLKTKVDELLKETKEAKKARKDAEEKAAQEAEELARKGGDVAALEKSWQAKLDKAAAEAQKTIDSLNGSITTMTVDNVAVRIANEIAVQGSADILIPHIKSRLGVELRDGQHVTVVRDAQGKPSAATLDELKTEFSTAPAFAPVIVGSKATGGGANGGGKGGRAATTVKRAHFDSMSPADQMAHAKAGGLVTD